jgi:hypothetical protein
MRAFIHSGILKLINSIIQFFPSILTSKILKSVGKSTPFSSPANGIALALLLFVTLSTKTIIENQYFFTVINAGASVKGFYIYNNEFKSFCLNMSAQELCPPQSTASL